MDGHRFDELTRTLARSVSRRQVLKTLAGTATGGLAETLGHKPADAYVCRQPGATCLKDAQCCSANCDQDTHRCGCAAGQTVCGRGCVDLQTDPAHCGACATDCRSLPNVASAGCAGGQCVIGGCAPGFGNCDGQLANGCETPLGTLTNCTGCGVTCPSAQDVCQTPVCEEQGCGTIFQPDNTPCGGSDVCCGGTCTNVNGDLHHCGSCGADCYAVTSFPECLNGGCCESNYGNASACSATVPCCPGKDLTCQSSGHCCIGLGGFCPADDYCCSDRCDANSHSCLCAQDNTAACNGNTCGTAQNSCGQTVNCGSCGGGQTCCNGVCKQATGSNCSGDPDCCSGFCVGRACQAACSAENGACSDAADCCNGSACANVENGTGVCCASGKACGTTCCPNATDACTSGKCCPIAVTCGSVCLAAPCLADKCLTCDPGAGTCVSTCAAGQHCDGSGHCVCDGTSCQGCCSGTICAAGSSGDACGTDGRACASCSGGQTCQGGSCACPSGTCGADCGGIACGAACCSGGQTCQTGGCACPAGTCGTNCANTLCGGTCVDTQTDVHNCGGCGKPCGVNQTCGGLCLCAGEFFDNTTGFTCCNGLSDCDNGFYLDPTTCGSVDSCPNGTTPCVGPYCWVCCPPGTTCSSGTCLQ